MKKTELFDAVRGRLIVSVQAPDGDAMRDTHALSTIAKACVNGGAAAIRCGGYGGLADITSIIATTQHAVPIFGLTKEGTEGVYITPSIASVRKLAAVGADIACVDATFRPRSDGSTFAEQVAAGHDEGILVMADIATPEEAEAAAEAGADLVSTTLAGYTPHRTATEGPDVDCIAESRRRLGKDVFLIGEGRFHEPTDLPLGIEAGADAIIVGTAITAPGWITNHFAQALHLPGN